jgi:hypothetical protein
VIGVDHDISLYRLSRRGCSLQRGVRWTARPSAGASAGLGKRKRGKTRKGNRWLRRALNQAAWGAARTKNTYFAARFHRLAAKRGSKRAIVAIGHKILVLAHCLLQHNSLFRELGADYYQRLPPRVAWLATGSCCPSKRSVVAEVDRLLNHHPPEAVASLVRALLCNDKNEYLYEDPGANPPRKASGMRLSKRLQVIQNVSVSRRGVEKCFCLTSSLIG